MARWFQFQNKTDPLVPIVGPSTVVAVPNSDSVPVQYEARLQYQAQSDPTSATQFISQFVGEWFESWTPPPKPRLAPALAIALAVSGLFATPTQPQAEIITADKWLYPWSEPVRQKAGLPVYQRRPFTADTNPIIPPTNWYQAWSEPVRLKSGIQVQQQQTNIWGVFTPAAETVTADKWLYQWSEPVRLKSGLGAGQQQTLSWNASTPAAVTAVTTSALSSPVFFKGRIIYQSLTKPVFPPAAEVITADKWIYPWSEPVKERKLSAALNSAASVLVLDDETQIINQYESRWHYPWSEPVRVRYAQQQQALAWSTFTPTAVTVKIDWFQPLSVLPAPKIVTSEATFNFMAVDNALTNYWLAPWPDFAYAKKSILPAQQQALAWSNFTPAQVVFTDTRWIYPWSEPVRTKRLPVADMAPVRSQTIQPPTILVSQWFNPLSEPVRVRQLPASEQQSFAWINFTPTVTEEKWHYAWSEPIRIKQFPVNEQQAFAWSNFTPGAEVITEDKWHFPWSEPVRIKRGLPASEQQFFTWINFTPTVNYDKWAFQWSEPVRQKPGLIAALQRADFDTPEFATLPTAPVATSTLSSPVFWRGRFIYQSYAKPPFPPTAEIITADKWAYQWSEPVRIKLGLSVQLQQPLSETLTPPIVSFGYYGWLTEPVRLKKGLGPQLQQSFAADTTVIPTSKIPAWLYGWSEPVRQKLGLSAGLQQFTTPSTPIFPNLNRLIQWFAPFNEPVRIKHGLQAWLQSFFTAGTKPIANVVTVTLDATETNSDTALFGISVYNRPVSANVSIKEIPSADTAYASIEET